MDRETLCGCLRQNDDPTSSEMVSVRTEKISLVQAIGGNDLRCALVLC